MSNQKLKDILLEKIGDKEVLASNLHVSGYEDFEISQILLTLELSNEIELVGYENLLREDGGLVAIGKYRKKQKTS